MDIPAVQQAVENLGDTPGGICHVRRQRIKRIYPTALGDDFAHFLRTSIRGSKSPEDAMRK